LIYADIGIMPIGRGKQSRGIDEESFASLRQSA